MPLTDEELSTTARRLAEIIFVEPKATAHSSFSTLKSLVQALDDAMEAPPTALPQQTSTLQANLNQIGLTVAPNSTLQQRLVAVQLWAAKKAGLI